MTAEIPTVGVCTCGARLVTHHRWLNLEPAVRAELRAAGYHAKDREGECHRCAQRRRYRPSERSGYTRDEVLSEWGQHVDRRESKRRNIDALAPRMGMTPAALERALLRAGVRAWAS
jgi:hypothetical protein